MAQDRLDRREGHARLFTRWSSPGVAPRSLWSDQAGAPHLRGANGSDSSHAALSTRAWEIARRKWRSVHHNTKEYLLRIHPLIHDYSMHEALRNGGTVPQHQDQPATTYRHLRLGTLSVVSLLCRAVLLAAVAGWCGGGCCGTRYSRGYCTVQLYPWLYCTALRLYVYGVKRTLRYAYGPGRGAHRHHRSPHAAQAPGRRVRILRSPVPASCVHLVHKFRLSYSTCGHVTSDEGTML